MEALNTYSYKEYNFILWFYRLLLLIITTIVVLVIVLNINETVTVNSGEIVAANPQADYKAPFEAQITKIYVKEGMPVHAGDTLLVMKNLDYIEQQANKKTEINFLQKKIQSIAVLQDALRRKKATIDQNSKIAASKSQIDINGWLTTCRRSISNITCKKNACHWPMKNTREMRLNMPKKNQN